MKSTLVIGLGQQGRRYLRLCEAMGDIGLVATVDPQAKDATYSDLDEALVKFTPDIAVVASPTKFHFEIAMKLIKAGIPTLIEKPLTHDARQATELVEFAQDSGVFVATGQVERFNPAIRLVYDKLKSGELGTPIALSFRRVGLPPLSSNEYGVVHDLAVHDIDIFSHLIGPPTLKGASGWPRTGSPESAFLLLSHNDVDAMIEVNWKTPVRIRQLSMTTDTCCVSIDYTAQKVEITQASDPENPLDFITFQARYTSAKRTLFEPVVVEPLKEQFRTFLDIASTYETNSIIASGSKQATCLRETNSIIASGSDGCDAVRIASEACKMIAD